jgi:VanZ family protein
VARYTQIISKASAWTLLITIVILSLVPAQDRPMMMGLPRLVEHFSIFFATGLVFGVGYPQRRLFQLVALLAFTAAIELAQLLVPGRHARLSDFLIDAWGVTVGLWIGFLASRKLTQTTIRAASTKR